MRNLPPAEIARLAGVEFEEKTGASGRWVFPALGHDWQVSWPELTVLREGRAVPDAAGQIVILNYLACADGRPLSDEWVPWNVFAVGNMTLSRDRPGYLPPLTEYFGNNLAAFKNACEKLDGRPADFGDAAYIFNAFPRIPLLVVYSAGDEEIPAASAVLFDRSASGYLPAEDLSGLVNWIVEAVADL
ncbi:MAG: DUF3786 domain-containing protein [Armatimonadetes bacterium]|nr:DUF3786 domain-containing protein [Armatimonadota bacterium]NIM24840.1 DUF3786 domain-containing protein [Armatimonadota bacterium]NIM68730.1 DUF3786 domain-containing protein [Armatimonadota bacterium]NIM76023.1 DUF3786 domain-containing protein [Armatimonadota bacterium]NIN06927.1 DUF3786 domain-containing protein [Armatimonadota bacterium]